MVVCPGESRSNLCFTRCTIAAGGTQSAPEASEAIFGKRRVEGKSFAIIVTPYLIKNVD